MPGGKLLGRLLLAFAAACLTGCAAKQVTPVHMAQPGDEDLTCEQLKQQIDANDASAVYDYEPTEDEILEDLLPRNLAMQVFRALLENNASFYGAQMSAMDNATRNAGDMIRKQTLVYNRTRQAMITKELIEIISGAEAI